MKDIRLAFRTLWKTPFVTTIAILSLALGIGANAAIFSLFDQMLLKALPVPSPDELVVLAHAEDDPTEIHGMRHREHPVWGVQFHPESIMTPHGLRLLRNFLELAS